jgi:hypothetical protein
MGKTLVLPYHLHYSLAFLTMIRPTRKKISSTNTLAYSFDKARRLLGKDT